MLSIYYFHVDFSIFSISFIQEQIKRIFQFSEGVRMVLLSSPVVSGEFIRILQRVPLEL